MKGTGNIFGVHILADMNLFSRITDRFYYKLGLDPLGTLGKEEDPRKVKFAINGRQIHILKQPNPCLGSLGKIGLVNIPEEIAKSEGVKVFDTRLGGQFVRMKLVHTLENPAKFLFGMNPPFVGAGLYPNHSVSVEIGTVYSPRNFKENDKQVIADLYVLGMHRDGAADVLACGITDKLVDSPNIDGRQTDNLAIVGSKKNAPSLGIGESRHFRGQRIAVCYIPLELATAIFTFGDLLFDRSEVHFGQVLKRTSFDHERLFRKPTTKTAL